MVNKMASKDTKKDDSAKKCYEPKATVRHAKIARTKKQQIEDAKNKFNTDRYLAKKYEAKRRDKIKELPKEEKKAAKAALKEDIKNRKIAEKEDKAAIKAMIAADRVEREAEKEDEDINGKDILSEELEEDQREDEEVEEEIERKSSKKSVKAPAKNKN